MARFHYYLLDTTPVEIEIPGDRLAAHEWSALSRMGGLPPFDPDKPLSEQLHMTDFCTEACNRPIEAVNRIHVPPGVPPPYWFSDEHKSWATLTPVQPPRPPGA